MPLPLYYKGLIDVIVPGTSEKLSFLQIFHLVKMAHVALVAHVLLHATSILANGYSSERQMQTQYEAGTAHGFGKTYLQKRDCYNGPKAFGCDKGYCWKRCSDGPWCWTALNAGYGDWILCHKDTDCNQQMACSVGRDSDSGCGC